jgi:DNA mismatch endonuclease (patch repair protein)
MYVDPEFRRTQSITKKGRKNGMFGKKPVNFGKEMKAAAFCNNCSKIYFKKRSELSKKNKITKRRFCSSKCFSEHQHLHPDEYSNRIGFTGKHTEESKQKNRLKHLGQKAWNKDVTGYMSKQARINIGNARKTQKAREQVRQQRLHQVIPKKDTKPEIIIQKGLKLNNLDFEKHKPIIGQPDIFIHPNKCIFVDGDYWHAHPKKYDCNHIILGGKTALEIWEKDIKITNELKSQGMKVYRFWESDIIKDVQVCIQKII